MKHFNRTITSREYKLILNSDRFVDFEQGEVAFWHLMDFLVTKSGGKVVNRQHKIKERQTWYLDTPDFALRKSGWALRLRQEKSGFKVSLKVRSPDRYVAAACDLTYVGKAHQSVDAKFEEDIVPPFRSVFAQSFSFVTKKLPKLKKLSDVARLFPGIMDLGIHKRARMERVNGFTAYETVRWVGKARVKKRGHTIKACISSWYPTDGRTGIPLVTEFSFDYDLERPVGNQRLESSHVETARHQGAYSIHCRSRTVGCDSTQPPRRRLHMTHFNFLTVRLKG